MRCIGFDNEQYLQTQSAHIRERINAFGGKLNTISDAAFGALKRFLGIAARAEALNDLSSLREQLEEKMRIFLDWNLKAILFLNASDGSHLYIFTNMSYLGASCAHRFPLGSQEREKICNL